MIRDRIKRALPQSARNALHNLRERLAPPPVEDSVLHGYEIIPDGSTKPRLNIVLPTVSPSNAFGGVTTGVELFLQLGKKLGLEMRAFVDDFGENARGNVITERATRLGLTDSIVEINVRNKSTPIVSVRRLDFFISYNWWTTLNTNNLVLMQASLFCIPARPLIYIIQDYEPQFYPFSSTHLLARHSLEISSRLWAVINTPQLAAYVQSQGHRFEREFVFTPRLAPSLRPFLSTRPGKMPKMLIYGRPSISRNCFPAIIKALRYLVERYPELSNWKFVSAGEPHSDFSLGKGAVLRSYGKLSLEEYAKLLGESSVGLSLMASPHPSYPPLEMAHFGVRVVTNQYANKDLSSAHDNILSIRDISPPAIANALALACGLFQASPQSGWNSETHMGEFLSGDPFECLNLLSDALLNEIDL